MPELQLTVEDRQMLRELDAAFQPHFECERAYQSAVHAYERLDKECAEAYRAARRMRRQRNALARLLAAACAVGAGYLAGPWVDQILARWWK